MAIEVIKHFFILTILMFGTLAKAYIGEVSVWQNDQGIIVYTGSDAHNVGSKEDNLAQLQVFDDNFFSSFRSSNKLKILFENMYVRHLNLDDPNDFRLTLRPGIQIPLDSDKGLKIEYVFYPCFDPASWIAFDLLKKMDPSSRSNLSLKSIDPRFVVSHGLIEYSLKPLFDIDEFRAIDRYLKTAKEINLHDPFINEMEKILNKIIEDQKLIIAAIFGKEEAQDIKLSFDVWKELDQRKRYAMDFRYSKGMDLNKFWADHEKFGGVMLNLFDLQDKAEKNFFVETLDLLALWEIKKAQERDQFLILAGTLHIESIKKHLENIGFRKVFQTAPFYEVFKQRKHIEGQPDLVQVPQSLAENIERGVRFMSRYARQ